MVLSYADNLVPMLRVRTVVDCPGGWVEGKNSGWLVGDVQFGILVLRECEKNICRDLEQNQATNFSVGNLGTFRGR